jgi:hypothetical protein
MKTNPEAPAFDAAKSIAHVRWEWSVLVAAWAWLADNEPDPDDRDGGMAGVALLEASLMHARNLHEFFGETRRHPSDTRAADFGFHRAVFEDDLVTDINRWVQHLTTWRYNDHEYPTWSATTVLLPVTDAMGDFLTELDGQEDNPSLWCRPRGVTLVRRPDGRSSRGRVSRARGQPPDTEISTQPVARSGSRHGSPPKAPPARSRPAASSSPSPTPSTSPTSSSSPRSPRAWQFYVSPSTKRRDPHASGRAARRRRRPSRMSSQRQMTPSSAPGSAGRDTASPLALRDADQAAAPASRTSSTGTSPASALSGDGMLKP